MTPIERLQGECTDFVVRYLDFPRNSHYPLSESFHWEVGAQHLLSGYRALGRTLEEAVERALAGLRRRIDSLPEVDVSPLLTPQGMDVWQLTDEQQAIAQLIIDLVANELGHRPMTDGLHAFHQPSEWRARGERYGCNSLLVVCHDCSDLAPFCSYDYQQYQLIDRLQARLAEHGLMLEQCTNWYSAVYPL